MHNNDRSIPKYSAKLVQKILNPKCAGAFLSSSPAKEEMRIVTGDAGRIDEANYVKFYLMVDKEDGVIADARFQAFGPPALIGAAEALAELVIRKDYMQAGRITADLLPQDAHPYINAVLAALELALGQLHDIPLHNSPTTPMGPELLASPGEYPPWDTLSHDDRLHLINHVIESDIRPYIELDEGGVQVQSLTPDLRLTIKYEGSCTSCLSATGSTLTAIQQILRSRVHPALTVIPEL